MERMRLYTVRILIIGALWLLLAAQEVPAAVLVLTSGEEVSGTIIRKTEDTVEINVRGKPHTYSRDEIVRIRGRKPGGASSVRKPPAGASVVDFKTAIEYAASGDLTQAEELFRSLLAVEPDNEGIRGAIEVCEDVRSGVVTKEYALHLFEGAYYLLEGEYEQAIEAYKNVLEIAPDSYETYYNLATAYQFLGQHAQARPYLEKLVHIYPKDPEILFKLSVAYQALEEHEKAIPHLITILELVPEDSESTALLGVSYYATGQFELGKDFLERSKVLFKKQGKKERAQEIDEFLAQLP